MIKRYYIAGNFRIGDCLGVLHLFEDKDPNIDRWIVCNEYNEQVWRFAAARTDLHINGIMVVPGGECLGDYSQYVKWCEKIEPNLPEGEKVRFQPDANHLVNLYKYLKPISNSINIPKPYVCIQPSSISTWKNLAVVSQVKYPYPVVCLTTQECESVDSSMIHIRHLPMSYIYSIILNCDFFVGICSAMTRFAAMLMRPTIMVHFTADLLCQGVSDASPVVNNNLNPNNLDIVTPTVEELQHAITNFSTTGQQNAREKINQ